jgi:hypothetical protein
MGGGATIEASICIEYEKLLKGLRVALNNATVTIVKPADWFSEIKSFHSRSKCVSAIDPSTP